MPGSKFTKERCSEICAGIAAGRTKGIMAAKVGISRNTLDNWLNSDEEFRVQFNIARAVAAESDIDDIKRFGEHDWRSVAWRAERGPNREEFRYKPAADELESQAREELRAEVVDMVLEEARECLDGFPGAYHVLVQSICPEDLE